MKTQFQLLQIFQRKLAAKREQRDSLKGFTLTELLVVVIIGSLIVTTLMTLVVQLVSTEQRESARTETQREMQLALDYIASDLRQAVFVYDNPSYLNFLPANLQNPADYRPVIAFWKPKPIDPSTVTGLPAYSLPADTGGCNGAYPTVGNTINPLRNECNNLWLQRRTYSLVVYFEVPNPPNDAKWKGRSRIERYELEKYSNVATFTRNAGYVDPGELGVGGFASWPQSADNSGNLRNCQTDASCGLTSGPPGAPPATPAPGSIATLVDFVDGSVAGTGNAAARRAQEPDSCPANYLIQPDPDPSRPNPSFFMCIRQAAGNDVRDIQLYVRGNLGGRPGSTNSDIPLSAMQTQLTMRGVIDKGV